MSTFRVVRKRNGRYSVESKREVLAEMDSEAAARFACDQLNYEPGKNPCDVFMQGRYTERGKERAA